MRILYLSQLVPYPLDAGPKIRIYHVLQYLASAGHEISLVAFSRASDTPEAIRHLSGYCREIHTVPMHRSRLKDGWSLARSLVTRQPFLITRDNVPAMHDTLAMLLSSREFDAVHADQLWMAQYALASKRIGEANVRCQTVLDQHNAVFLIPQRLSAGTRNPLARAFMTYESRRLANYEATICGKFDQVVWVSADDQAAVDTAVSGHSRHRSREYIIPIGVDSDAKAVITRRPDSHRVTFLGGLHWPPNLEGIRWFVRSVWPEVLAQHPDAILTVIGRDAPEDLTSAGIPNRSIELTGYVDDPLPYLEETAVFIVPLHAGGGMRVKILDSWAWGLPIVSTSIGAEGLAYEDGQNLLIADTSEHFASAVIRLLSEPVLAARLGSSGRRTLERNYDWRRLYASWDAIYGRG